MARAAASFLFCFAVAAIAAMPSASAAMLTWPGSPGCTGTLQACVDASGTGDTIEIATDTPVDENVALGNHSLALTSAAYHHASFAAGRSIESAASVAGSLAISVSKLRLRDGHVWLYAGPATATYDVRELDISQSIGGASAYIRIEATSGAVNATVYHNRIRAKPASLNSGLIELVASGATMNAYAAFNTIARSELGDGGGAGLFVNVAALGTPGGGYFAAFGNEVRGTFNRSGIFFSEGLFSTTPSTLSARAYSNAIVCSGEGSGQGIGFVPQNGSIDLQALNNTITGCNDGILTLEWNGATGGSFSGTVWNNLIVAERGLEVGVAGPGVVNDYNLIDAASNNATLGPHTIIAPAQLSASAPPRLAAGSPAIDAADGVTLAFGIIDNGLPVLDADGLRRLKLGGADIGAYEFGDVTFDHTADAANSSGNLTAIDNPTTNGNPGAYLFATRKAIYGFPVDDHTFGVWYSLPGWTLYYEDFTLPMDLGARWNVFVPASGEGAFAQIATAGNTSGSSTTIDNAMTNSLDDRIVLVRHDWTRDATYLDHPVGVFYSGSGSGGRWNIGNVDGAAMPLGVGFDVYAQPPSPNAFRIDVPVGSAGVLVDHPLINGVACAMPHVSRVYNPATGTHVADFNVTYDAVSGRWAIASEPAIGGDAFNVVIDAAEIAACTDRIFADGFDG